MTMKETPPTCDANGVFCAKVTCAELGVCYRDLRKLRELGLIEPTNPGNKHRPKYSGQSIRDCWEKMKQL